MKYFKFAKISEETGISWAIEQPTSGPSFPKIPGLDIGSSVQLAHVPIYYVAKVDDSAESNPANHIFEITSLEYAQLLNDHVLHILEIEKTSLYKEELEFRNSLFGKYHDTASLAGVYKYQQAQELLANANAVATEIRLEAQTRGVTPTVLANRIVQNHQNFREKESKIAGIRGKVLDRLEAFVFDLENPDVSYADFVSEETVGTQTMKTFENGELVDKEMPVKVGKYKLSLSVRFQHLN